MRILHFADLHLGVESYGSLDPASGLSTRLLDILKALDRVIDFALESQVDLVLFCGDAYKSRDPSQTQQREFARRIKRLSLAGVPVFLLVGNHDLPNAIGRATTVEIFDTLAISNVYVADRGSIHIIPTRCGPLQIAALPWPRRNLLLSREESKNLTLDQMNERIEHILTDYIDRYAAELDPSLPSILAAHVSITTAKSGSERTMLVGRDPVLLPSNIAHPAFDYVALGHLHKHQELPHCPPLVYAGSLERLDFSEEDDEKGFYLVELDEKRRRGERLVAFNFQEIEARRFLTIKVDLDSATPDPTLAVLHAIGKCSKQIKDAIVRLQISLSAPQDGLLQGNEIRKALREAHYFTVAKEVKQESRIRLGAWSAEELTPPQALKVYLETKKIPAERQKLLLEYAERLMGETDTSSITPRQP